MFDWYICEGCDCPDCLERLDDLENILRVEGGAE